jgi:hypothetical protein
LGFAHPKYLLRVLNAKDLAEWEAYFMLEPHGDERLDWNFAQLCQLLANCNRNSKSKPTPYKMRDFKLDFDNEPKPTQTAEEMKRAILSAFGKG